MRNLTAISIALGLVILLNFYPQKALASHQILHKAVKPAPSIVPKPAFQPKVVLAAAPQTNDRISFIMSAVNNFRVSRGLSAVSLNSATCGFAAVRVSEIVGSFSHDGFYNRVSNHTLPYSGYSMVIENLAHVYDYQNVVNMWINSPTHQANLLANTPYACVAENGDYYAFEGWMP